MSALLTNNKLQRATHNIMAYRIHLPDRVTHLQVSYIASSSSPGSSHSQCLDTLQCSAYRLLPFKTCNSCRIMTMMVRLRRGVVC